MLVTGGSTSVIAYFQMRLLAGGDATGLTITDFDMTYTRSGDTPAAKVDAGDLGSANAGWDDDNGYEVDPTDAPGLYRFDFPDAAFAAGVREVLLTIKHTSCFTETIRCTIDAGVSVTKWAGTATSAGVGGDGLPAPISLVDRNAFLIESLEGGHTYQGNHYYVDPVNGDTHANGNRGGRTDPYLTIQDCHDNAVTDSNHDVIFLVAGHASTATTHTIAGTTTLSKRYLSVRGPGRDFIITRTGSGDTLAVTADGVALSGFQLGTAATGSGHGIKITDADFAKIEHVWVLDTQGDGVHILRGSNCVISLNTFAGTGVGGTGQGVHIVGTAGVSSNNRIVLNVFADTAGDSVLIEQGTTNDTLILNNVIHGAGGWGINIGASSTDAIVQGNVLGDNTTGDINDDGTTTVKINNEQWAQTGDLMLADLTKIHGTALTETAGQLAARFKDFFDQDSASHNVKTALSSFKATGFAVAGDSMALTAAAIDAIMDELLTGATHNVTNSMGRRIRELDEQIGYQDGAIWVDTVGGVGGTTVGEHGTVNNPVNNITDALALAVATKRVRIRVASGSTITLLAAVEGYEIYNANWTLVLNGKSISGSCILGAEVSGIATGASRPKFIGCQFGAVTLPPCTMTRCGIGNNAGTFTGGSAGQFVFHECFSVVPGSGTPSFVFTGLGSATGINNRAWAGGASWTLDSDCTLSHEVLAGGGTTVVTGGADVEIRGTTRSLTLTLSNAGTVQFVGTTGPVTISGTATSTVNLYGIRSTLSDSSSGTTVNDLAIDSTTALSSAVWTAVKAGYLDVAISTRTEGVLNIGAIADAVLREVVADHKNISGSLAQYIDHLWQTTEDDGGVRRFSENALEQAPSGTGASAATIAVAVLEKLIADHSGVSGSLAEYIAAILVAATTQAAVAAAARASRSVTDAYCTQAEIESYFGRDNIRKWADLNNNKVTTEIEDRIAEAINRATEEIDARLRGGQYNIPLDFDTMPRPLVKVAIQLAGDDLYSPRGAQDFDADGQPLHRLRGEREAALEFLRGLRAGVMRFDEDETRTAPEVLDIPTTRDD